MSYKDSTPEIVLEQNVNASRFLDVLDAVQEYKTENISNALRTFNGAVSMNRKWLIKYIAEYGLTDIPYDYPIQILTQTLLNIDSLFRMRGSIAGLEFMLSLFSLGDVLVDAGGFYAKPGVLLLDDLIQGHLTGDNDTDLFYCLIDDNTSLNEDMTLIIKVKSKFFSDAYPVETQDLIKDYIQKKTPEFLGFSPSKQITHTFEPYDRFVYSKYLNPYFHP